MYNSNIEKISRISNSAFFILLNKEIDNLKYLGNKSLKH